jgi:hypothetical protein
MVVVSRAIFPESFLMKIQGFQKAASDLSPIMPTLEKLAWEDNEEGLLRGTDKDGRDLVPLSPRTLANPRRGPGGPLIPRSRASRFIANYRVGSIRRGDGNWTIIGAWENILSKKGVPFAPFHFDGAGRLPRRDLRGVRPEGRQKITDALSNWLKSKLGGNP